MQTVLEQFTKLLPHKPYCTDNFVNGIRIKTRENALECKYIQAQIKNRFVNYLIFDIDWPGAALAHERANLPAPTITIVNPKNSHAHLLYQLTEGVSTTEKSSQKAIKYLNAIEHAYKVGLRADFDYGNLLIKNPLSNAWKTSTNNVSYELSVLAEYVDLKKYRKIRSTRNSRHHGRNVCIFNTVRKDVYKIARNYDSKYELFSEIFDRCHDMNRSFSCPLNYSEINGIAKSITKYTFKNRFELLISERSIRLIESAARTIDSNLRIKEICKYAQKELIKRSGLSADTIQRYMNN